MRGRAPALRSPPRHRRFTPPRDRAGGCPPELRRLQALLARGLAATAPLWSEVRIAYGWVHRAAHLLANAAGQDVFTLRRAYRGLLAEMHQERATMGALAPAITHFRTV